MKKILLYFFILSSFSFTFAQNQESLPVVLPKTITKITSVADVNVSDVVSEEKDGMLKGSFQLTSGNGKQNEIVFGVVVFDKSRLIVDMKKIGEEKELYGGNTKKYNFEYAIPKVLSGELSVELLVSTLSGLPLGSKVLSKKEYKNTTKNNLSCVSKDEKSLSCLSKIDDVLIVSYVKGSLFSNIISSENVAVKKDVSKIIVPNLSPGKYTALITNTYSSTTKALPIYIEGAFGEIQNILVTEANNTVKVTTVTYVTPLNEGFLEVSLFDTKGKLCETKEKKLEGRSNIFLFNNSCKEGNVSVRVLDGNKTLLVKSVQSFKTENSKKNNETTKNMNSLKNIINSIAFILLIAFVFSLNKIYKKSTLAIVLLGIFFSSQIHHVSATTLTAETWGPYNCGGTCEIAHTLWVTVNSDKSSYAPGETMQLTADVNVYRDAGANSNDTFIAYGEYNGSSSGGFFNTSPSRTISGVTGSFHTTNTVSVALSSSLSAGTYTLPVSGHIETGFYSPSGGRMSNDSSSFSYTIAAVAPPTVNIQFSFFDKVKTMFSDSFIMNVFALGK